MCKACETNTPTIDPTSRLTGKVAIHPEGMAEINRWLSAATPPESVTARSHPGGMPEVVELFVPTGETLAPLEGASLHRSRTGGVAMLNHRLISVTPAGVENEPRPAKAFVPQTSLTDLFACVIALLPIALLADDAPPPVPPKVAMCTPLAVPTGATTKVILRGWTIDKATAVKCDNDQVALKIVTAGTAPVPGKQDAKAIGDQQLELEIITPADLTPEQVELTVVTPSGESMPHTLLIGGDLPLLAETEPNDGFRQAQPIATSQIVDGQIHADGNVDVFSFELTESTKLQIEVQAAQLGSCLDSLLTLYNAAGSVISSHDDQADTTDSELDVTLGPGRYFVCLQDAHDRGGPAHPYRLIVKHSPAP